MFRNERMWPCAQNEKPKRYKTKKLKSKKELNSRHLKNSKCKKPHKNHKLTRFKCMDSDYVGPERLTKHVGLFTKGKISDYISRIEKVMPREVNARARQDLQEVLKLTCSAKNKHRKSLNLNYQSVSSEECSLHSLCKSPQYLLNKTGFASNSWKDKIQQSVGLTASNSVLASVHKPQVTSPVKELQLIAREILLTKIHPFIKKTNRSLYPSGSHKDKIKLKLQQIRNQLTPCIVYEKAPQSVNPEKASHIVNSEKALHTVNSEKASSSSVYETSQVSSSKTTAICSQETLYDNFHLNPIFTGDDITRNDLSQIFPPARKFTTGVEDSFSDTDTASLPDVIYDSRGISCQETISNVGKKNSVALMPTSSTSDDNSPVWKLQVSPVKFQPTYDSTPTLFFRHKMF